MKDRKRQVVNEAERDDDAAGEAAQIPPAPEAQGDGEPVQAASSESAEGSAETQLDAERQLAELSDKYLRLAAEYDNYRKRTLRERIEAEGRGQAELVTRMLEAIDDLSRFAHIDPAITDIQTLHKGIELVERKLLKVLGAAGLEIISPVDQSFDPNLHEAITTEPALSKEDDNTVAKVYQAGYRFNGQLLRPARVVVKQWNG